MNEYICIECGRRRFAGKNMVMIICRACQNKMVLLEELKKEEKK